MFSSIMVSEEVRRLFQVLTGEDMTDADEGGLFAVADALESDAVEVEEIEGLLRELVGKVRTEFSGKAADRFAGGLEGFDGLLASGGGALRELAVFVRDLARQVRYLKLVTIYGLELLLLEMAWAVAMAGATGGASMAWLAARMAVMRMLLSRWWGQLFMRLAMAAAGGVAFNVLPDVQAQLQMLGEKSSEKWDGKLSEQSAGMGAFSALVSLPMSAVGGLVSNALTTVLVRGLGDEVDAAILEAAVRRAVAEHAELYPVSAMARFADVVSKSLDVHAGMSVRAMWAARFADELVDAWENALSELLGEVAYQAAMGLPVTWNLYALSAGGSESVAGGVGNLTGLAWRGKLHPDGPSPYLDGTGREDATTEGGGFDGEKAPLRGRGSGSQTGNSPGSPDKTGASTPSDASDASDRPGTPPPAYSDGVVGFGQDRPGTPPPAYSDATPDFGSARSVPPPRCGPVAGGDQVVAGVHGVSGVDVSGVSGNRTLDVLASQTQDSTGERSTAGIPHVSGVPWDSALPDTVTPGSGSGRVADLNGEAVSPGRESSVDDRTGQGGSSGVDSVAGGGDRHRGGEAAVSPDSATLPVNTVRVPVPADVVAGGGLVEFVRGGVADSAGGPVLLVSPGNSNAGVVVSPGQGSALAREVGRDVVAMTPGQGGRGPQRTVFAADGSAPRPVAGPGAPVPAGSPEGLAGLADSPAAAPAGTAASGRPPVRQGSRPDVRREIDRARKLDCSGDDEPAAQRIVQDTRDLPGLARGDAAVSLEEVPALVAAEHHELGRDHQDQVVELSQTPAESLGTQGTGPGIHAGAGPQPGRDMLSQSADDPGSETGEPRARYVVHGDPGRKADDTAQAGHDFSLAAHDPHDTFDRAHQDRLWREFRDPGDGS
ncbi:WXG100-like domain-containing protein [Saccharopolyspora pogona]|uniref:WXG100-like domain-containing protein n=1 Tax=Saccharopolyspora pogona TaxID=333966 RepID=UPI001CC26DAC|nr:hypothetical protein [Saccharopolyspora pogona]